MSQAQAATLDAVDALAFTASPAVSARVRQELLDSLRAAQPGLGDTLLADLAARDFHGEFAAVFAPAGLQPDNLASANAGYWAAMWSLIHDAALPNAGLLRAAQRQLAQMWAVNPVARRAEDRQAMAELMIFETVLALEQQRAARADGPRAVQALARHAHHNMMTRRGVNLRALQPTGKGFVRAARR